MASQCRTKPQKAKGRPPTAKPSTTRGVQTSEGDGHDDPQESFESDLRDDREQVLQVRVDDKGSLSRCVKVEVQGVSMYGIMDSGQMFKKVLKSRDVTLK